MNPIQTLSMGDDKSNIVTPEAIVTVSNAGSGCSVRSDYEENEKRINLFVVKGRESYPANA